MLKSRRNNLVRCLLFAMLVLTLPATGLGQNQAGVVELKSAGCEIDEANFNVVRVDALEGLGTDGFLIAVARLGSGDKKRNLNHLRLSATKQWLNNAAFPLNKVILAEGERVNGAGRVEFYIGGKLTHIILPAPNFGLCVECCNPRPEDFTSYRRRKKKRR